ncbi:MAG: hypothetical protein UX77_C0032G0003 [Parcubacteria group bacterium GW2011_GWA1_47_11]|nr:MAG: hypothetical protein UX77_C0032G0003 [Parcubacteria group bacterium GW2011_GWA1_47_11]
MLSRNTWRKYTLGKADTNPVHEFEKKIDEYEEDTEVK